MKRLCIYVTYDSENIADQYIGYMLHELRKVVNCLVVVCNYKYIVRGIENIQPYADKIYYRTNIGFDVGAYKDVLCHYLGWEEISQYDELLLINDSFFGPLYPIENLFHAIESQETDYWGITRSLGGKLQNGYAYHSHIQSYFLGFKKKVVQDSIFKEFWEEMRYPETLEQAIILYEIRINEYMKRCGFEGIAITDIASIRQQIKENENPYMLHSFELVKDVKIPILKRKSLSLGNIGMDNALKAYEFIAQECDYNIQLINDHLLRHERKNNSIGLDRFYEVHSDIYIYGAGLYGKNLAKYFEYRGWTYKGYLVTDTKRQPSECVAFEDANITERDGIIIAVGNRKVFFEISQIVQKRCKIAQIFNPYHILGG